MVLNPDRTKHASASSSTFGKRERPPPPPGSPPGCWEKCTRSERGTYGHAWPQTQLASTSVADAGAAAGSRPGRTKAAGGRAVRRVPLQHATKKRCPNNQVPVHSWFQLWAQQPPRFLPLVLNNNFLKKLFRNKANTWWGDWQCLATPGSQSTEMSLIPSHK